VLWDSRCRGYLDDSYARQILLAHTEGFDYAARAVAESNGDVQYYAERLDQAVERLFNLLLDAKALSSSSYRALITHAMMVAVLKLRDRDPQQLTIIADRLRKAQQASITPLSLRLSLVKVIEAAEYVRTW
jgi:hypothetical protein